MTLPETLELTTAGHLEAHEALHARFNATAALQGAVGGLAGIWISQNEIAARPAKGLHWDHMKAQADATLPTPEVGDQRSLHDEYTVCKALVWAKTGTSSYRTACRDAIAAAIDTEEDGVDTTNLAWSRNVLNYVVAADIIDLPSFDSAANDDFAAWITLMRTKEPLTAAPPTVFDSIWERSANPHYNQGSQALACAAAIAVYLGETGAEAMGVENVYKRFVGAVDRDDPRATVSAIQDLDNSQWSGGQAKRYIPDAEEATPHAINPVGSTVLDNTAVSRNVDGCLVADQARSEKDANDETPGTFNDADPMTWPPYHKANNEYYSVGLHSLGAAAEILYRAGKTDVFLLGDQALKRAHEWVKRLHGVDGKWYGPTVGGNDAFLRMARQMGAIPNYRYGTGYPVYPADPVTNGAPDDGSVVVPAVAWTHMTGGGGASGGFVKVVGSNGGNSVSSLAITVPAAGVAAGNTIAVCGSGTADFLRIVDSKGNLYVQAIRQNNAGTRACIFYAYVDTALVENDTITVTFAASATTAITRALEFSGVSQQMPLDRTKGATGSATAMSTGAMAETLEPNELLVACFSQNGLRTFMPGTDWTEAGAEIQQGTEFSRTCGFEYRLVSVEAAYTGDGTSDSTGNWAAAMAAFRLEAS